VGGEGCVEEEFDGLLVGHGWDGLDVGGVVEETLLDGLEHEGAHGKLFGDVVDHEALGGGGDGVLVEGDGASGIDVGDHAEAYIDRAEEIGFEMDQAASAGVDPDAAFEAGEEFGLQVGGRPLWIGFEVEDDEWGVG